MNAAVGIRDHSGWAAVVVLVGDPASPAVLERRKVQLIPPGMPREAYHAAAGLSLRQAQDLVTAVEQAVHTCIADELASLFRELSEHGHTIASAGIAASASELPALERILRVHALLHAAEGHLYREALADTAASHLGLRVSRFLWRDVYGALDAELGLADSAARGAVAAMGKTLGPPWTSDQKDAAAAAWLALLAQPTT